MKLNDFKDDWTNDSGYSDVFHDEHSDKSDKLDRNTIIVSALAHYYDYNNLSKEEGREVIRIIMDIQKNKYEI